MIYLAIINHHQILATHHKDFFHICVPCPLGANCSSAPFLVLGPRQCSVPFLEYCQTLAEGQEWCKRRMIFKTFWCAPCCSVHISLAKEKGRSWYTHLILLLGGALSVTWLNLKSWQSKIHPRKGLQVLWTATCYTTFNKTKKTSWQKKIKVKKQFLQYLHELSCPNQIKIKIVHFIHIEP